jgi:hypothetical protein
MVNIRVKGQNGEREIAALLDSVRNLDQTRDGGGDVASHGLLVEVKRHETLSVNTWWKQACLSADKANMIPVLAYRQNRKPWVFCIPAYFLVIGLPGFISMDQPTFMAWYSKWKG